MSWTPTTEPIDYRTPIDDIEPVDTHPYREASERLRDHFVHALEYIVSAPNARKAAWVVAYAYCIPISQLQTQTAIALGFGITRQAMSKEVTRYLSNVDLACPINGRSNGARQNSRTTRDKQLNNDSNSNNIKSNRSGISR
jgi:hypothetical protein